MHMILTLAGRNMFHDRVRLVVTLTGVVFAVVLITVQLGLYYGFTHTISSVIAHTEADIWICSRGLQNFDIATPLHERKDYKARATPGVAWTRRLIVNFANWKKPLGGEESVEIVGLDPRLPYGVPWNVVQGEVDHLRLPDAVIVDEIYREKLGVSRVGDQVEINGVRARVAGFTRGIKSFTTSPFVFTDLKAARRYLKMAEEETTYVLVRSDGARPLAELKADLAVRVGDVDVFTSQEFLDKSVNYWMFTTGAGLSLLIAAALGLVVGVVIVAQTLYATTIDHLAEFGTLRAMGASSGYVCGVIVCQAVISAVLGYGLGQAVSALAVQGSQDSSATILVTGDMRIFLFFLTLAMCVAAAYVSIFKVLRIDPVSVFRGR